MGRLVLDSRFSNMLMGVTSLSDLITLCLLVCKFTVNCSSLSIEERLKKLV